jgi:hypothetical protein
VLLRAMAPLTQPPKADLTGKPVLIVSGRTTRLSRRTM